MSGPAARLARAGPLAGIPRRVVALVATAVGVRLLAMPFTLHFDAYQIYSRAHEAAYHGAWFSFSSQILIQSLHNLWLLLVRPLLPESGPIWSHTASTLGVGASQEDYTRFLAYDHLYRAIFLMKLPYVVADLACAWVLTRLVAPARRFAVAAFWLLNPLVIFSSAVYGRHDVVAILLTLLSLAAARRGTDAWRLVGLALLGTAALMRFFPLLLVAPFLLAFRRGSRQLGLFVAVLGAMAGAVELAGWAASGQSTLLTILGSYEHFRYWFDAGLYLRFDDFILLFPLGYALGLFWMIERGVSPEEYPRAGALVFLLLFSVTFFHPHYAVWLVPFLALTIAESRRMLLYHGLQIVCIIVYTAQWGSWTTWDLLKPILGARTASLPDPVEAIQAQIEPRIVFGFFRSVLTATCLWMGWRLIRGWPSPRPPSTTLGEPEAARATAIAGEPGARGAGPAWLSVAPRPQPRRWVAPALVLPLLLGGCSATVAGYSSPLAHDYGPLAWPVLGGPVEQAFIAGPGTSAAIDNDATTTPEEFAARLAALPPDARTGRLDELRIGLRLADDVGFRWETGARLHLLDAAGALVAEFAIDALPHRDGWVRITDPPQLPAGTPVRLRLVPGDGPDAGRLQFGLTSDRAPFGGWKATTLGPGGAPTELNGALLVWTRYERDVDARGVLRAAGASLRGGAERDAGFAVVWLAALGATGLAAARAGRRE